MVSKSKLQEMTKSTLQSMAYLHNQHGLLLGMVAKNKLNSMGWSTDPCGTAQCMGTVSDKQH